MRRDHDRSQAPGGGEISFEEIYLRAGRDFGAIPWAALAPHPALVAWLDAGHVPPVGRTLIVGCGLGDDAEEAARRGYQVTAFDLSPTAIGDCQQRFPGSAVDYQVADLFRLPASWHAAFGLVVEIRTLQSLPLAQRTDAAAAIAATEPAAGRPWPVSRRELHAFTGAGLRQAQFRDQPAGPGQSRSFTVSYRRPDEGHTGGLDDRD
jgi:SAM-dependent methyltransferase